MARDTIILSTESFYGGSSIDPKIGIGNAFYTSQAMDFRKQPSQMSSLPGLANIGGNVITDLVQAMIQAPTGNRYALGDTGNFYQIDTSNTPSLIGTLGETGAAGLAYRPDTDTIFAAGLTTISTYAPTKNSPTWGQKALAQSQSLAPLVTQTITFDGNGAATASGTNRSTGTSNTYAVPVAISESSTDKAIFYPDIEPAYSVKVYVVNKGTGNLTLTLHDVNNTVLATQTIANASLTNGTFAEFVFSSQVRINVTGNFQYHFHLTQSGTGATVGVVTTNDLSTGNYQYYAYRLVQPNNGLHPMAYFNRYLVVGNERYISIYDGLADVDTSYNNTYGSNVGSTSGYDRHRLVLPAGYEVCGLTVNDEYIVIAAEKRSTNGAKTFQDGYLFFWDGNSASYNFAIPIPMGSPQSPYSYQNMVYFLCNGALYAWVGGLQVVKVRTLDYTDNEYTNINDNLRVFPNMMTIRRGILCFGFPSTTTNPRQQYGIYSWGSIDKNFPQSFGYSYVLSNGLQNYSNVNNLKIGSVTNFNDTMYVGWSAVIGGVQKYGLDMVDNNSTPSPSGNFTSLTWSGGQVFKQKLALRGYVKFLSLPSGYTITPFVILDRTRTVNGAAFNTTGGTMTTFDIPSGRANEVAYGYNWTQTGATQPLVITGAGVEVDPLPEEWEIAA